MTRYGSTMWKEGRHPWGRAAKRRVLMAIAGVVIAVCLSWAAAAEPPDVLWAASAGGSMFSGGSGVAVDAAGNVYVTGRFTDFCTFRDVLISLGYGDAFVAKYSSSGDALWGTSVGGPGWDHGRAIAVDGAGNVFVTGTFEGTANFAWTTLTSAGGTDVFVAKYDSLGDLIWARRAGGPSNDGGRGIAVDGVGNVYVTGAYWHEAVFGAVSLEGAGSGDIFVAKYDTHGNVLWAKRAGGPASDEGLAVAADGAGSVYVTGWCGKEAGFGPIALSSAGERDVFVAMYDGSGGVQWAKRAGGSQDDGGSGIAVAETSVYVTGWFEGEADFGGHTHISSGLRDVFVAKYDSEGSAVWARRAGGLSSDQGNGIAVDIHRNVFVTGEFWGTAGFDGVSLMSAGLRDVFLAAYDDWGGILWAAAAGGAGYDRGDAVAAHGSGDVSITGCFAGTATLGDITLTSTSQWGILTAEWGHSSSP